MGYLSILALAALALSANTVQLFLGDSISENYKSRVVTCVSLITFISRVCGQIPFVIG